MEREAARRRFRAAARQVILGDGAPWIGNLADERFPQAIQIVDRYHVKEHVCNVAKAIYRTDSEAACRWAQRRHQKLDAGRWRNLAAALARHAPRSPEAGHGLQYLERNRHRMRYPLPRVSRSAPVHFLGSPGGRMQSGDRGTSEAFGDALD